MISLDRSFFLFLALDLERIVEATEELAVRGFRGGWKCVCRLKRLHAGRGHGRCGKASFWMSLLVGTCGVTMNVSHAVV